MSNKKVIVLGAGGIVGQHMLITKPSWVDGVFTRTIEDDCWTKFKAEDEDVEQWLDYINPDVIVNLAGQNIVDVVEQDEEKYIDVNINLPIKLAKWVDENKKYLIQVSTQGIFSGENPEYTPKSKPNPITWYGKHKAVAEKIVMQYHNTEIVRLTFVIGVRPFQNIGRKNPLEFIFEQKQQTHVNDRFFSPVFAQDAASILWERVLECGKNNKKIIHVGNPIRCSRFSLAEDAKAASDGKLDVEIIPVSYTYFSSDVARPRDTTWKNGETIYKTEYIQGLKDCYLEWERIQNGSEHASK